MDKLLMDLISAAKKQKEIGDKYKENIWTVGGGQDYLQATYNTNLALLSLEAQKGKDTPVRTPSGC